MEFLLTLYTSTHHRDNIDTAKEHYNVYVLSYYSDHLLDGIKRNIFTTNDKFGRPLMYNKSAVAIRYVKNTRMFKSLSWTDAGKM